MDDWISKLEDRPLNQIIIPGSHNSGAYGINASSKFTSDVPCIAALVPCIVAAISKCQEFDLIDQLNRGVRLFDLRIGHLKSEQWLVHGQYSVPLKQAFQDFSNWLEKHPKEIVMLMASYTDIFDLNPLISLIGVEKIITYPELTPTSKLSEFWKKGQTCIIITDDKHSGTHWSFSQTLINRWPNKQETDALKLWQDNYLPTKYSDKILISQLILSPTFSTVIRGGVPKTFAEDVDQEIMTWLNEWKNGGKALSVIMTDFVGVTPNLLDQIIALND